MRDHSIRPRLRQLLLVASAGLLMAACGPTASPTSAPPTSAATGVSAPSAPTAVARPTQPTTTTTTQVVQAAQPASTNDVVKLVLDQSASQARYHAREQLVGRTLASEAIGASAAVSGTLVLGMDGSVQSDQSKIEVDLRQLKSDESRRDNFIQGSTLQTGRFPLATFVPSQVQGLASPLPTSGEATFQLLGDLTVHGVTKPVTWQVSAQFSSAAVTGNATTNVNFTDFGMTPPKAGPVLSIEDGLTLEMVFTATREAT